MASKDERTAMQEALLGRVTDGRRRDYQSGALMRDPLDTQEWADNPDGFVWSGTWILATREGQTRERWRDAWERAVDLLAAEARGRREAFEEAIAVIQARPAMFRSVDVLVNELRALAEREREQG